MWTGRLPSGGGRSASTLERMAEPKPIQLRVFQTPNEEGGLVGRVVLGQPPSIGVAGNEVDIGQDLVGLEIDMNGAEVVCTIQLRVELEFDFPVDRVAVASDQLEGLTAKELTEALASGGYSSTPGETILAHLRTRAAGRQ